MTETSWPQAVNPLHSCAINRPVGLTSGGNWIIGRRMRMGGQRTEVRGQISEIRKGKEQARTFLGEVEDHKIISFFVDF